MPLEACDFHYLAYHSESGVPLAHGARAVDALDQADRLCPDGPIMILDVHDAGAQIWRDRLSLGAALAWVE
jgi:hypothetical protein